MMAGQQPIFILRELTKREGGKSAQENNITVACAISEAVRSTLGPKRVDKILMHSMDDIVITNEGTTIFKEIDVQHPAAKMLVEVAKSQDHGCGDGRPQQMAIESFADAVEIIPKTLAENAGLTPN